MEENTNENQDDNINTAKRWLQDNLRILISVAIVVVIAGGIYSYSKRSQEPADMAAVQESEMEQLLEEGPAEIEEVGEEGAIEEEILAADEDKTVEAPEVKKEEVAPVAESKETGESFIESAQKGEGTTHMARRALANYLEKSADSELTAEHKIYIEDYLRKNVGFSEGVFVGTTVEFSKSLIKEAIAESKNLNDAQLKNLHKYAVLVPSLS